MNAAGGLNLPPFCFLVLIHDARPCSVVLTVVALYEALFLEWNQESDNKRVMYVSHDFSASES